MADSAVGFVLGNLVTLLQEEAKLWGGVRNEVGYIKDELQSMQAFLRDAEARGESDEGVKAWVEQVRFIAFDTEDVLDEFVLRLSQPPPPPGPIAAFLRKISSSTKQMKANHWIANQIQDIKNRVRDVADRSERYRFNCPQEVSSPNTRNDLRDDALLLDEAELVGIDKRRDEIIGWLVDGEIGLGAVSVVGMGGLGKTTLVKKVYDSPRVKGYFKHHAWITVSQSWKVEELLRDVIEQLFSEIEQPLPRGLDTMKETKLKEVLKEFLRQKRYVIVFDDVWSMDPWNAIKYALPDGQCGSRILVTTRSFDVASSCMESCGHVYKLKPLSQKEAWILFCRKAFRSNRENKCPPELEELSHNILRRCEGLPLAIVAIGGLLSMKDKTEIEWKMVNCSLAVEFERNNELTSLKRVLSLSYSDLPYYLRSCFLYLSIFPEDYLIKRTKLLKLWIAEGFIKEREGMTMEDVAEGSLKELINRSLIQVAELDFDGRVRSCQVHDLMREIIISKSQEENFTTLVPRQKTLGLQEKIRRLSILNGGENILTNKKLSCVRSLFVFGMDKLPNFPIQASFHSFRLLKVLDLEGAPLEMFPCELLNLVHLKYLSMRKSNISEIPKTIIKLQSLETLDLKHTLVSELPKEILKLHRLCHILVYSYDGGSELPFGYNRGIRMPVSIGSLITLQKLSVVEANTGTDVITELGKLIQLRRLSIIRLRKEDASDLCNSISKMEHLRSFSLSSLDEEELIDLQSLSYPPPYIQRLYLKARLDKLPHWISSLHNLVKMRLGWTRLRDDSIGTLHNLPNLVELSLFRAYEGEHICFKAGGFQSLKVLILNKLEGLDLVTVGVGAMPHLQHLSIMHCAGLKKVPIGIEHLAELKELHLVDISDELETSIVPHGGQDHWKVEHIALVWLLYWTGTAWKRYTFS